MANRAIIVTDLGYGDAGKGTTVDYLVRQAPSVVIRHNGGSQAAHNVVMPDGRHHTFSQFGSGSFVTDVPTHLSRFMLVNPFNAFAEAEHLHQLGVVDVFSRLTVDEHAIVVTPWHMMVNQLREILRGGARHGSCGQGIGETMADSIDYPELTIRVGDLSSLELNQKLRAMWQHKRDQALALATQMAIPNAEFSQLLAQFDTDIVESTQSAFALFVKLARVVSGDYLHTLANKYDQLVFEGAQGVLLDEWFGFHPYTTWSTTTHQNAQTLLAETGFAGSVSRLGLLRSYATRHGAGPFVTEDVALQPYLAEPHNSNNDWQHGFRVGHPDMVAMRYALEVSGGVDSLVVTHLDRAPYITKAAITYATGSVRTNLFGYNNSGEIVRIIPGKADQLVRQESITKVLESCQPVYQRLSAVVGSNSSVEPADGLVSFFSDTLALPVSITSFGPTWADKRALVAC